jgi:hypothetical protein
MVREKIDLAPNEGRYEVQDNVFELLFELVEHYEEALHNQIKWMRSGNEVHCLNIELVFILAAETSLYQLLDRMVFGELKSLARHAFFQLGGQTGIQGATPEDAITILVRGWAAISPENV